MVEAAHLDLSSDLDGVGLVGGVGVEAAPPPVSGMLDQARLDWVAMHVTKFLDSLGFGEDIEIVVAGFPDEFVGAGAGEALLEDLNRRGQFVSIGLG